MKLRGVELAAGMIITTVCKKHYVVLAEEDQNNSFVFADLGSGTCILESHFVLSMTK